MSKLKDKIDQWQQPPEGFIQWIQDIKPMIPSKKGGFEVFIPNEEQLEFFYNALQVIDGYYKYQTIVDSEPRRHSKTIKMALLCLWRFTLFQGQLIVPMANSQQQVAGVSYKLLRQIILNTKFLREQIGQQNVKHSSIDYPALQNSITPVNTAIAGLYGQKISVAWITEIHSCPDIEAPQVLASSLGDTENSWYLVDSTVDPPGGPLENLEKAAKEDPTIYIHKIEYRNLKEALDKSPHWISRSWLKSREKQLLPATFASQHLNKRSEASNNLFSIQDLNSCKAKYPNKPSLEQLDKFIAGKKCITGAGLDRAFFFSKHQDKTVWVAVAKTSDEMQQPIYYVLNIKKFDVGLSKSIKKEILDDNRKYGLKNICFEMYNSQDLATWCSEEGIANEIIQANNTQQESAFQELAMLVHEQRILFPEDKETENLFKQMRYFSYELTKTGRATFGTRRRKDDYVYALAWAVYSLRKSETIIYELESISCNSLSKHARYCYLRNGDLILNCAETCPTHLKVKQMYNQFKSNNVESDLTLQQFYNRLVKVTGAKIYKAV